jgi:hypothetical protein
VTTVVEMSLETEVVQAQWAGSGPAYADPTSPLPGGVEAAGKTALRTHRGLDPAGTRRRAC